ncbi:hypothetical protein [Undibacterium umbellatum]|uniref:Uncharacterized protein n=1 Tax=Undibacterium umbellatum TaxID=2762300 RepID=A0ABR6Z3B8_9BURK|nr:hypothetical protein [Undibacterium umbellatum]MBC3906222.1 hypothetical protein [Undibacterium umbellatum]
MMASSKRTKKVRKPWNPDNALLKTQPWRIKALFDPLLAIVDQLECDGTADIQNDGTAVFKDVVDGYWYESYTAIMGVVDVFEIHEKRAGVVIDMEPLRRLASKLKNDVDILLCDTEDCRACFNRMHSATLRMTVGYASGLIRDTQIQEQVERLKEAA